MEDQTHLVIKFWEKRLHSCYANRKLIIFCVWSNHSWHSSLTLATWFTTFPTFAPLGDPPWLAATSWLFSTFFVDSFHYPNVYSVLSSFLIQLWPCNEASTIWLHCACCHMWIIQQLRYQWYLSASKDGIISSSNDVLSQIAWQKWSSHCVVLANMMCPRKSWGFLQEKHSYIFWSKHTPLTW